MADLVALAPGDVLLLTGEPSAEALEALRDLLPPGVGVLAAPEAHQLLEGVGKFRGEPIYRLKAAIRAHSESEVTVHGWPRSGSASVTCCNLPMTSLPELDRVTKDSTLVTCRGAAR